MSSSELSNCRFLILIREVGGGSNDNNAGIPQHSWKEQNCYALNELNTNSVVTDSDFGDVTLTGMNDHKYTKNDSIDDYSKKIMKHDNKHDFNNEVNVEWIWSQNFDLIQV